MISHLDSEDKGDPLVVLADDDLVLGSIRLGMDSTSHVFLNIIRHQDHYFFLNKSSPDILEESNSLRASSSSH